MTLPTKARKAVKALTPLERLKRAYADPIGCRHDSDPICTIRGNDLRLALAVIEAAKARHELWSATTYTQIDGALRAIQEPSK